MTFLRNRRPTPLYRRPVTTQRSRLAVETLEGRELPATGLGVANDFSAFVLHDTNAYWSAIAGRTAVGGNASFTSYGIGNALANSHGTRDDLIVGGNLQFTYGQVFNGNTVYGGTGTFTSFGHPNGTIRKGSVINFVEAETQLRALSDQYAALPANGPGSVQYAFGTLTLTGTKAGLNVFNVTAGQLWNATNLIIKAPAGSSVIVNVSGANARMQYMGMSVQGTTGDHVLLNFPQATNLKLAGIGIQASVLAPRAALDFSNGNLAGNLVVASWTGYGHIDYRPPEINGPIMPPPSPSQVSGFVYIDQNRDGMYENGESRMSGVTVYLWFTGADGKTIFLGTKTDANGGYTFSGLTAGTYNLVVPNPSGYSSGHASTGTFGGTVNWNQVTGISVPEGTNSAGYNFGMVTLI